VVKHTPEAVVPGPSILVRNVETGEITSARTNPSVVYTISFPNPGQHEAASEQSGFNVSS